MHENGTDKTQISIPPLYNIKAVARMLGLLPVTLRAWERRYGLPSPQRGEQGYRLYSEQDLDTLRWLKGQVNSGLSISRAVEQLNELQRSGQDPIATQAAPVENLVGHPPLSPCPSSLSHDLLTRLTSFDETGSSVIMRRAFALYSVDQVLLEVVTPALVQIGELWHAGQMPIATEHFASQFCMQHLMGMLAASSSPVQPGLIVAACAPGETHQIGLLMLVVMLRWRGWNVKYLGSDLNLKGLAEALAPLHPSVLMFTATRPETAHRLIELQQVLEQIQSPKPLIILGGRGFESLRLPEHIPAVYLNSSPAESVKTIETLVNQQTRLLRTSKEKSHV